MTPEQTIASLHLDLKAATYRIEQLESEQVFFIGLIKDLEDLVVEAKARKAEQS